SRYASQCSLWSSERIFDWDLRTTCSHFARPKERSEGNPGSTAISTFFSVPSKNIAKKILSHFHKRGVERFSMGHGHRDQRVRQAMGREGGDQAARLFPQPAHEEPED